jgi:hypothetical protein|tara:strand:+ start:444 stop:944 length:501 start_codon:yes stop_codon:yes gene_type:complete
MLLTETQWNDIKRIKWNQKESNRIRERVHDDSLIVGWCGREKRWMLARIVDATVEIQFGVKTIPTKERVPFVWKVWEDDDGSYLDIRDPRLIPYIRRCDLWRMGSSKYLLQYDKAERLEEQREKSTLDDLVYKGTHEMWKPFKQIADQRCGTDVRHKTPDRFFFMN